MIKFFSLVFSSLLVIIPLYIIIKNLLRKEKVTFIDWIIPTIGVCALVFAELIDMQSTQEMANLNLQIEKTRLELENAKKGRDSILSEIQDAKLKTKEAEVKIGQLKIQGIRLKATSDSLYQTAVYERTARYSIEANTIKNRNIYQYGPVIDDLKKIEDIKVNFLTIDNGEAINTRDRLITLFIMVGWQVNKKELFDDSEFEYLIPKSVRKTDNKMFGRGIIILYNNEYSYEYSHDEFLKRIDSIITSIKNFDISDLILHSDSQNAAELLEKHLLAMGVYAHSNTAKFYNIDVKKNEIYVIVGKQNYNDDELVTSLVDRDEQLKKLRDFYKNYRIQIRNNKIINN